jgi:HD-like signal output (HDOD) protein
MAASTDSTDTSVRLAKSIMALPPLPATAQKILTCFGDEFIDAANVASVVEGDPGICAKLLGLSNSAYFGLAQPVNDIGEAISRVLGVDTVRSLALAMAIQQSFNAKGCPRFDVERFWKASLMTAECCKNIASADNSSDDAERDLAYSAGLCHNLGLLALSHIEPVRTEKVLRAHREPGQQESLSSLFQTELETNHRIMTAELARIWSLPAPMIAAYQYRAFPHSFCDDRLGLVVAAGVTAVENADLDEELRAGFSPWAESLGITAEDIQRMATFGNQQKDRVESLARNMTA